MAVCAVTRSTGQPESMSYQRKSHTVPKNNTLRLPVGPHLEIGALGNMRANAGQQTQKQNELENSLEKVENSIRLLRLESNDPPAKLLVDEQSLVAGDRMSTNERMNVFDWFPFDYPASVSGSTELGLSDTGMNNLQSLEVFSERWRESVVCLYRLMSKADFGMMEATYQLATRRQCLHQSQVTRKGREW